jgi:sulfur-oxidizing protein SoxZ
MTSRTLINVPKTAKKGEVIEIRAMIAHKMETGYRHGPNGETIPRDIINRFVCTYDGEEIFSADFYPAVSANPFVSFSTVATASGTIGFAWTDDKGETQTATAEIAVT